MGDGEPLGLLHQQSWTRSERTGKRGERRKKTTMDKESQRWLDTLSAAEQGINPEVMLVHIGDREADIYDLFVLPRQANSELLIRAESNRKCQSILETAEWRLLRRKFEPKNRSKNPPTLRQAVRWIAQLGGFLARRGDGEPGLKTLWRGIGVLHHLREGAQLAAKT